MNEIKVGIADLNVAAKGEVIVTYALGSCVGICIYDGVHKVAGLSHIMLPDSTSFTPKGDQVYKFADLAIPLLIQRMERMGAKRVCMKAKIAGGAQMFTSVNNSALSNIGERNVIAVKRMLQQVKIPIIAEDTGKNFGRTQYFDSSDGTMTIKAVNHPIKKY